MSFFFFSLSLLLVLLLIIFINLRNAFFPSEEKEVGSVDRKEIVSVY